MFRKLVRVLREKLEPPDSAHQMHQTFHEQRAIFVHIPKAAGSSVCLTLFGHQVGHYTMAEWRAMDRRAARKYFSFSFVREPADRLHSAFRYLQNGGMNDYDRAFAEQHLAGLDFPTFVERLADDSELLSWIHFRPQHEFLQAGDRTLVSFVGRFESMEADFAHVAKRLGKDVQLPRFNETGRAPADIPKPTRDLIRRIYAQDYQAFCY